MLLTLWALRWCWVGMLAVVAYLRHAVSKGVSSPGTLRVPGYGRVSSLCDDECGDGDDVAVMMLCRRVGNALFSVTPLTRSVSGECVGVWRMSMPMRFGDALLREWGGGPQGGPVFS